jgi:serine/threonine-protein kinase
MLSTTFDASTLTPTGTPVPLAETIPDLGNGMPVGDVSPAGLVVFSSEAAERELVWVSRDGAEEPVSDTLRAYMNPRLSPDGSRIVVQAGDLWVHDLRRKAFERISTPSAAGNAFPMWLPDGTTVMHRSGAGLRLQSTQGGESRTLPGTTEFDYPGAVTADRSTLLFYRSSPETSFDIFVAPLADPTHATALLKTPAYEAGARLSIDGRWMVYVSNESGRNEVYVRPFQGADRRWQVSTDGGSQPAWNPTGNEVFYRIGDRMMSVALTAAGNELQISAPRQLFSRQYAYGAGITIANYDVSKDGQRFVMVKNDTTMAGRLQVILNWHAPGTTTPVPEK